jgi:hypothetical protein
MSPNVWLRRGDIGPQSRPISASSVYSYFMPYEMFSYMNTQLLFKYGFIKVVASKLVIIKPSFGLSPPPQTFTGKFMFITWNVSQILCDETTSS